MRTQAGSNSGLGVAAALLLGLAFLGGGKKAGSILAERAKRGGGGHKVPSHLDHAYLAARRAELTAEDLEALWRMVQSEKSDGPKVDMVWAVINRAHKEGVSVRQLLMPAGKPAHQLGGHPPFSTWRPVGKDGQPLPSPPSAAAEAEGWVNQDPTLEGAAVEFFEPAVQDKLAAEGAALRHAREQGKQLSEKETQIARYVRTADDFRKSRPGKSLGLRGPLEFFRA